MARDGPGDAHARDGRWRGHQRRPRARYRGPLPRRRPRLHRQLARGPRAEGHRPAAPPSGRRRPRHAGARSVRRRDHRGRRGGARRRGRRRLGARARLRRGRHRRLLPRRRRGAARGGPAIGGTAARSGRRASSRQRPCLLVLQRHPDHAGGALDGRDPAGPADHAGGRHAHHRPRAGPSRIPIAPHEAAALLGDIPLLVVHGDVDRYFPLEHPRAIHEAAAERPACRPTCGSSPASAMPSPR